MDVGKMIVSVGADARQFSAELGKAAAAAQAFADRIEQEFAQAAGRAQEAFSDLLPRDITEAARALGLSAQDPLVKIMAETAALIEAELNKAFADNGELARLGKEGGAAYKRALEAEVARISQSPAIQGQMSRMMRELNATPQSLRIAQSFRDAEANAARLATTVERTNGAVARLSTSSQRLTGTNAKLANASISVAFALQGILAGGDKAEAGVQKVLRAVATLGPAFGSTGLLVSGVAASAGAIIGLFTRARDEMRQTAATFKEEMDQLIRNVDVLGIQRKLQSIEFGDLAKGRSPFGGMIGGLQDLEGKLADLTERRNALKAGGVLGDLAFIKATKRVDEVTEALRLLNEQRAFARIRAKDPLVGPTQPTGLGKTTVSSGIQEIETELERLQRRTQELLTAQEQFASNAATVIVKLPEQIVKLYDDAIAAANRFNGVASTQANALRAVVAELKKSGDEARKTLALRKQFGEGVDLVIPGIDVKDLLPSGAKIQLPVGLIPPPDNEIDRLVRDVVNAKGLLDLAKPLGDKGITANLEAQLATAQKRFETFAQAAALALLDPTLTAEQLRAKIEELEAAFAKVGKAAGASKLGEGLALAVQAGRGLLGIADGMGRIGTRARQAIGGVLDLTDAIGTLSDAKGKLSAILAGGIGAAGAVIQFGAAAFGETETERERNRLQKENNELLTRLSQDLQGFANTIGRQLQVGRATSDPELRRLAGQASGGGGVFSGAFMEPFLKRLGEFGLSLAELNRIAKDNGINLLDEKGFLVAGAMDRLNQVLAISIEMATQFGKSLDDLRTIANLEKRVLGKDPGGAALNLEFLKTLAPEMFAKFFAGIDPSDGLDPEELARAKAGLKAITEAFILGSKEFSALFGDLFTDEQLTEIIIGVADGFDELAAATDKLTGAMMNVPRVLKVATLAFQAQRTSNPLPTSAITEPGFLGSSAPVTFQLAEGSIVVQVGSGDGAAIARTVLGELQTVARSRFGDGRRWPEVN